MPMLLKRTLQIVTLLIIAILLWIFSRPDMSEVGIPYAEPATAGSELRVRWLGVSTLLFDDGETQILTDGFVTRPPIIALLTKQPIAPDLAAIKNAISTQKIDRLAAIMPVHSHYDHALDTADFAILTGADILGSESTANIARSSKVPLEKIKTVTPGTPYSYGKFTITFYRSRHAPLPTNAGIGGKVEKPFTLPQPYTAWQEGQSYSIHIAHPEANMLVQGSAGFVPGALQDVQADIVFLGSGGLINQTPEYVSSYIDEVVHALAPEQVYIIHQDNLLAVFGNVEQSKLLLSFDKRFAFDLMQLVLPAQLMQMHFGVDVGIRKSAASKTTLHHSLR